MNIIAIELTSILSFSFSVGDCITAVELAKKVRKKSVDAPSQFKDVLDDRSRKLTNADNSCRWLTSHSSYYHLSGNKRSWTLSPEDRGLENAKRFILFYWESANSYGLEDWKLHIRDGLGMILCLRLLVWRTNYCDFIRCQSRRLHEPCIPCLLNVNLISKLSLILRLILLPPLIHKWTHDLQHITWSRN